MRLVHAYNREKVERYLHKQRLEKIARLEELDQRGELSDRAMLSETYELESTTQLLEDNNALAEEYLHKALRIHLETFEQGKQCEVEHVIYDYRELARMAEHFGTREKSEQYYQKAEEYEQYAAQFKEPAEDMWDTCDPYESPDEDALNEIFERK